jgi:hypothetical protein
LDDPAGTRGGSFLHAINGNAKIFILFVKDKLIGILNPLAMSDFI